MYDLTTFVTENIENESLDGLLEYCNNHYLIKPFEEGLLFRPVPVVMGRDGVEVLVNREFRDKVVAQFATIHYTVVEGV